MGGSYFIALGGGFPSKSGTFIGWALNFGKLNKLSVNDFTHQSMLRVDIQILVL